jgi:lysophospholipase L1-like esterase
MIKEKSLRTLKRIHCNIVKELSITLCLTSLCISCAPEPTAEIAVIGDSVSWGYGALPEGWLIRLENRTGYKFANLGIPGEKAAAGAERVVSALRTAPNADTVIVLHGGNDWVGIFRGNPCLSSCEPDTEEQDYERVAESLRSMRNRIKSENRNVIFATYWPGVEASCPQYKPEQFALYQKHLRYLNSKIKKVASEHADSVVDLGDLAEISSAKENYFDCLHPSGKGYDMITARWLQDMHLWEPKSKWAFEF